MFLRYNSTIRSSMYDLSIGANFHASVRRLSIGANLFTGCSGRVGSRMLSKRALASTLLVLFLVSFKRLDRATRNPKTVSKVYDGACKRRVASKAPCR